MPATATKQPKLRPRDRLKNLLIGMLCDREFLHQLPEITYFTPADKARHTADTKARLAASSFELEKLMIKATGLDHLDGVTRAYGLKRRIPRSLHPILPAAATAPVAQPVAA